ncbi:winged helix-turn-helix domain-containing protein [Pseudomonas sp. ADAK2]|uniref:winged helix-turn-helix domain-containing protein n=1 Tax=unclassified Pseudomonas TaxID=196821 RepID=UPI00146384A4|nr:MULTISPECIES: helix-turn-helix domain-containing protein [unclassified Pseudomonas]QJI41258.1 winged helix-turn-helix domain-containing protein [Pseudomonas sp. ADAK7]QJI47562.1 winged helix-turn-helix domain-containing protein [Pseudomonas sp. ADAK2]
MEISTTLPRKYFVVVTHSTTSQRELETILSSERFNSFGTSQAQMFIEGVAPPSSAPVLMEFTYPSGTRKHVAHTIEHETQKILATLEAEWLAAQSGARASVTPDSAEFCDIAHENEDNNPYSEVWQLDDDQSVLIKENVEINLTGLEAALVKKMLHHEERVVSRDDLILSIGREPEQYRGLEMCLSRLQDKFKSASKGERLFRAVRNRGYCLIQEVVTEAHPA